MYLANFNSCKIEEIQVIDETDKTVTYMTDWGNQKIKRDKITQYSIISDTREKICAHLLNYACQEVNHAEIRLKQALDHLHKVENIIP